MTATLLATVSRADVHALAYAGIQVYSCFSQIRDMLRDKFGEEYALLFAEPVENGSASAIDWYTSAEGPTQKLADLPESAKEQVIARISDMAQAIQAYADELVQSSSQMRVTRGHILNLALQYPDNSYIYTIGNQPVFVCWGFGPGTPGVEPQNLTRLLAARPAPAPQKAPEPAPVAEPEKPVAPTGQAAKAAPVTAPVAVRSSLAWLWWLLPVLLALLLFWLLFTSFGGVPTPGGKVFFEGPALAFLEGPGSRKSELLNLRTEIDSLRAQLDKHIELCVPQPAAPVPEKAKPEGEALVIPEKGEDTQFLQGEWLCRTGLMNVHTKDPVEVIFTYDGKGHGKAIVLDRDDRCVGNAEAELHNGELIMTVDSQICEKSQRSYNPVRIICKNAEGSAADCNGINQDGSRWRANFIKVK